MVETTRLVVFMARLSGDSLQQDPDQDPNECSEHVEAVSGMTASELLESSQISVKPSGPHFHRERSHVTSRFRRPLSAFRENARFDYK